MGNTLFVVYKASVLGERRKGFAMGRRTIAGHKLTFNIYGKPLELVPPAALLGERLQDLFLGWAKQKQKEGMILVRGQSFLRIVDVKRYNDCIVLVETMSGKAGESGEVYDSENGKTLFSLAEKDVPTSSARAVLVCPPRGDMALWFSEYSARSSGASLLLELFKKDWRHFDTGLTFNKNRLIASEIALDRGLVTEVEVRLTRRSDDRGRGIEEKVGTISHKFKPTRKFQLLGSVIDRFRSNPVEAYELVEIRSPREDDEAQIYVSVDVEGHSRKIEIFNPEDGVYFREELNASGEPILNNMEIISYCIGESKTFFRRAGGEWDDSWAKKA